MNYIQMFESDEDLFYSILEDPNFKTDKCSGGISYIWDKLTKKPCPYNINCVLHDSAYFIILKNNKSIITSFKNKFIADTMLSKLIWNDNRHFYDKPFAVAVAAALYTFGNFYFLYKYCKK